MPFDGTVEWVLAHATEARDLIESSQRALLNAYHVRLSQFQPAQAAEPSEPKLPRRVEVAAPTPWWKKVLG